MLIEELIPEQNVKLIIKLNSNILEFETTVKKNLYQKDLIAINVIRKDDKLITFKVPGLLIDLVYNPNNGVPVIFKNVSLTVCKEKNDDIYYVVKAPTEGKSVNRRENYRVYIGRNTIALFGLNRKTTDVLLKDISSSGFAVIVSNPEEKVYKERQMVNVSFSDWIEETGENYSFRLLGTIVRVVPLENEKGILYGCSLNHEIPGLDKYLTTKERIRIRNTRS